jgi:hypothetical protein
MAFGDGALGFNITGSSNMALGDGGRSAFVDDYGVSGSRNVEEVGDTLRGDLKPP